MKQNSNSSDRRLAENELMFKEANQRIQKAARENLDYKTLEEKPLEFYCECSDSGCRQKIKIPYLKYKNMHENRKQFLLKPGHEIRGIEQVIAKDTDFVQVEKFIPLPDSSPRMI